MLQKLSALSSPNKEEYFAIILGKFFLLLWFVHKTYIVAAHQKHLAISQKRKKMWLLFIRSILVSSNEYPHNVCGASNELPKHNYAVNIH